MPNDYISIEINIWKDIKDSPSVPKTFSATEFVGIKQETGTISKTNESLEFRVNVLVDGSLKVQMHSCCLYTLISCSIH